MESSWNHEYFGSLSKLTWLHVNFARDPSIHDSMSISKIKIISLNNVCFQVDIIDNEEENRMGDVEVNDKHPKYIELKDFEGSTSLEKCILISYHSPSVARLSVRPSVSFL